MIKLPQDTMLGKMITFEESKLRRFILDGGDISYGVRSPRKFSIITGKNHTEKDMLLFRFPYIIDERVIVDVRAFVNNVDKYELEDMINKRSDLPNALLHAVLLDNKNIYLFRKQYIKILQLTIGNKIKSQLNLDINSSTIINNIVAIYATKKTYDYEASVDTLVGVAQANVLGEKLNENDLKRYISGNKLDNLNDLLEVFSNIDELPKSVRNLTMEVLNEIIGSSVYASHRLQLLIGVESVASLISLVYLYHTNSLYNKSQLNFSIKTFSKSLDLDYFESNIRAISKEYNIDKLIY